MKSNELFEQIHSGRIKEKSKINVYTEEKEYITTIEYKNGRLEWKPGDFDTRFLCDIEIEFEVEENKEIEELNAYKLIEEPYMASLLRGNQFDKFMELLKQSELEIVEKIGELVRAVNKLIKETE